MRKLHEEIEAKEQTAKVRKRDKVYETLETMLDNFFAGKYQIDKDTFQIKFRGSKLNGNASKVLSDGEKSIVAFCWYLAETHTLVEKETDYDNLFFVIDDPISSMDFHFVYVVAQILRSIKSIFGMSRHERLWVFTHNIEFLASLREIMSWLLHICSNLERLFHLIISYCCHMKSSFRFA